MKITIGVERIVAALIIALLFATFMHHTYTGFDTPLKVVPPANG